MQLEDFDDVEIWENNTVRLQVYEHLISQMSFSTLLDSRICQFSNAKVKILQN